MRITIVVPPFTRQDWPALGAEQVATISREAGHTTCVYYACLLGSIDPSFADTAGAPGVFTPIYRPDLAVTDYVEELVKRLLDDQLLVEGQRKVARMGKPATIAKLYLRAIIAAREITARAVQEILGEVHPDVVAFSIASDLQKMPSAAIARNLRAAQYRGLILAGGSALDGEMGPAFLQFFPEIDGVLEGEVEDTWPQFLCSAGSGWMAAEHIPGSHVRRGGEIVNGPGPTVSATFAALPGPQYTSFLEQRKTSASAHQSVTLLAETSRSCWWGEKHQCLFCGVDSVSRPYRQKSVQKAVEDLVSLWDRYFPNAILLTDSIMPHRQMNEYLYELSVANSSRRWHLFYEVKSTLSRRTLARLASAGVAEIQPGIESFSSHSLALMNKGATALQQVNLLKWAQCYGIAVRYPILAGSPGETAADLATIRDVLGKIGHLDPPTQINRLALLRGSPYWSSPERYGLSEVRPFSASEWIYQAPPDAVLKLEAQAAYRNATWDDSEYQDELVKLEDHISYLHGRVNREVLGYHAGQDALVITRSAASGELSMEVISDSVEIEILLSSEEIGSRPQIAHRLGMPLERLDARVDDLVDRRLLITDGPRLLSLALPFSAETERDADWPRELANVDTRP